MVKNLPAVQEPQETRARSLGREGPLEESRAAHSSLLAWRMPMDRGAWRAAARGDETELDMTECAQRRPGLLRTDEEQSHRLRGGGRSLAPRGPPPACTTQTGQGVGPEGVEVTLLGREESSCPRPWEPSAPGLGWGS